MPRTQATLIAAMAVWLAACAHGETPRPSGEPAPLELLQGVEINRIGRDRLGLREFQDRAMARAVAYAMERGVPRQRVERITVETFGGQSRGGSLTARRTPVRFTLWMRVQDCDSNVVFNAGPTGQISAPRDRSGCLATDGRQQ